MLPDPTTLTTEELLRYVDTTDPVTGELAKRLSEHVHEEVQCPECDAEFVPGDD